MTTARALNPSTPKSPPKRKEQIIYWSATGMVTAVMLFSIVNFNLPTPVGPRESSLAHLGLPRYFLIELTVAKTLGLIALLAPGIPRKAKEFAYAGFAIVLASASFAHFSSGDGLMFVLDPLVFLGALLVSYRFSRRIGRSPELCEGS